MLKKLSVLLIAFYCAQAFAFDLTIIGENHQSPDCKTARREYIQQALDQKLHLGMEGFMLDDLAFNQDITPKFPGGGFTLDDKTQIYGLEEKQLYALAGLYMNQSLMEIAKRLYEMGNKSQKQRVFQSVVQFMDLVRKYPEIAKIYYGEGKVPADIIANLKALLDVIFTDNGLNTVELENFEQNMKDTSRAYRQLLTDQKLYSIDVEKLAEAASLAAKEGLTSSIAAETYLYNHTYRNDVMVSSVMTLIDRIKAKGTNEFYIITGRRHALTLEKKINEKKIPDLNIQVMDLCY